MRIEQIVRENLRVLASPATRDIALSESVGGNAGSACYALNLGVEDDGRIAYVGNAPDRVNATLRIYVPSFVSRQTRLTEMAIDFSGPIPGDAKAPVLKAAWLWNLRRDPGERPIVQRFLDGTLSWAQLMEFLRTKYPELVKELE